MAEEASVGGARDLRADALAAYRSALEEIDPRRLLAGRLRLEGSRLRVAGGAAEVGSFERVRVIAVGKAAAGMVEGLEGVMGGLIEGGVVLSNSFPRPLPGKYRVLECDHPLPTARNVEAARVALETARAAGENELVICLVSGGGSAIFSLPAEGISLEDKRETVRLLLLAGAPISELNTVRKHISALKGGQLLRAISPASALGLYLSDVPGDDPAVIASGPTVPDPGTFGDAWSVVGKHGLEGEIPQSVARHLRLGLQGRLAETPKPGDTAPAAHENHVVGCNRDALAALESELRACGYWTMTELDPFEGEARELGRDLARRATDLSRSLTANARPYALIAGGETTVTVRGDGLGGRNCELALAAAVELAGLPGCLVLAGSTDGVDGPTDAAGALADGGTVARARDLGLDARAALDRNDSYRFFEPLEDLILTGPTGTNLMDVTLALVR